MTGDDTRFEELTEREREVIALMARGLTNGQIGERLGISFETAKWHVAHVISKTGAQTREEAVERWREHRRAAARFGRRVRAMLAVPVLVKSVAVAGGGAAAAIGMAVVVTVAGGTAQDQPEPTDLAATATTEATAPGEPGATLTVDDAWLEELRFSLIAQDLYEVPVVPAAELEIDGVTWGVGVITEVRHCVVTIRDAESHGMSCAGPANFPRSLSIGDELTDLLWMPFALGEPSLGFGFAGVAPTETARLEFETPSATYRIDAVSRPEITSARSFFIFATPPVPAEDGILRAFDAGGEVVAAVEVKAPTKAHPLLQPRQRP